MTANATPSARVLIVESAEEMRDAIKALLKHDGYAVDPSRDEEEAVERIRRNRPDLILISLSGVPEQIIAAAQRIRLRGGLTLQTPVIIFSFAAVSEGAEENIGGNIYITAPDNFNQLRSLLRRVLRAASGAHY
jgi:DNA-binding response OmpR family regulator